MLLDTSKVQIFAWKESAPHISLVAASYGDKKKMLYLVSCTARSLPGLERNSCCLFLRKTMTHGYAA
jgi:hypothetical protein